MLSKIKKNYFLLISTFLILYFFFNLLDGERGLFSYFKKKEILLNLTKISKTIVNVGSLEAAEMVKLINNTFRDVSFSFANEVALKCDEFNINCFELIKAANEGYPRNKISLPSPGVGGYCLTKDPYLFSYNSKLPFKSLGEKSREINEKKDEIKNV